jgi:hypothetical protein
VWGSCDGRTTGMFDEAVTVEQLEPIRHKRGLLGGCDAHTDGEKTSVSTSQAR